MHRHPQVNDELLEPGADRRPVTAQQPAGPAAHVMHLQRSAGNRAVGQLLAGSSHPDRGAPAVGAPLVVQRWYADAPMPQVVGGAVPLPFATVPRDAANTAAVNAFVDGLARPAWYDNTREVLLDHTESRTVVDPFTQRETRMWPCASCGNGVGYAGVDLGHVVPWQTYLKQQGVLNAAEARAAYNDLNNLRVECATCNRGHDFEPAADGDLNEGGHPHAPEGDDDMDFVEQGPATAEDDQAMAYLRWQMDPRAHGPAPHLPAHH